MKRAHPLLLALVGTALLAGCQHPEATDATTSATPVPPAPPSTAAPADAMTPASIPVQNEAGAPASATTAAAAPAGDAADDADFYNKALAAGEQEIQASQLAATQSSSDNVKAIATMLIQDHAALAQQVSAASHLSGVPAEDPAAIEELKAKSGAEFDKAYLTAMKRDHEKAISLFKAESESGKTNAARSIAGSALPKLHAHFKAVSKALDSMPGAKKK